MESLKPTPDSEPDAALLAARAAFNKGLARTVRYDKIWADLDLATKIVDDYAALDGDQPDEGAPRTPHGL